MRKESELYTFNIMSMFFQFLESRSANKCLTCHEQNAQKSAENLHSITVTNGINKEDNFNYLLIHKSNLKN